MTGGTGPIMKKVQILLEQFSLVTRFIFQRNQIFPILIKANKTQKNPFLSKKYLEVFGKTVLILAYFFHFLGKFFYYIHKNRHF